MPLHAVHFGRGNTLFEPYYMYDTYGQPQWNSFPFHSTAQNEVDMIHILHYAVAVALHLLGTAIPIADFSLYYLLLDA